MYKRAINVRYTLFIVISSYIFGREERDENLPSTYCITIVGVGTLANTSRRSDRCILVGFSYPSLECFPARRLVLVVAPLPPHPVSS